MKLTFLMRDLLLILLLASLKSFGQETIELANKVYDPHIKTVQVHPRGVNSNDQLLSPVVTKGQPFILEFDELFNDAYTYQVKYIRCEADWSKSLLSDLQFLKTYNEFTIENYDYSFNTLTPYVHYKVVLPSPILSGNYVLVVYADGDPNDVIITHRFMVFDNLVNFTTEFGSPIINKSSPYNQNLQFEVNYSGMEIQDPNNQVSVTILQNQRWDNAKYEIKPTFIREGDKKLEYQYFTNETTFPGGNEFRYFDMRSLKYFGERVKTVHFEKDKIYGWVDDDKSRANLAYTTEQMDLNGEYVIDNIEGKNPEIENDYAKMNFTLESEKINGKVYLAGELTNWELTKDTELTYDESTHSYKGSLVLKQGWYNYEYLVVSNNLSPNYFEGNWSETRNQYEIIVYYRPFDLGSDLIIGYLNLNQ